MQPENPGNLDSKDRGGNSPLHLAATAGHVEAVKALINLGSSVNQRNQEGGTPLHRAAEAGHKAVVKMLLDAGADPSVQDNNGATPCHLAAGGGHIEIMELMSKRDGKEEEKVDSEKKMLEDFNKKISAWKKPMDVKTYARLRSGRAKADEASTSRQSRASTSRSVLRGNMGPTQPSESVLYEVCVCVNRMSEELDGMVEEHSVKASINEMSRSRIDVNARYYQGYTPLHMAARYGAEEATRKFLKKKADIHARTESGLTPIILAAAGGSVRVIKMLVRAGASLTLDDPRGLTPIHVATYYAHESAIRFFHSLGMSLDAQTVGGETALHIACRKGDLRMAIVLLQLGATKDIPNRQGVTPLLLAIVYGHHFLPKLLFDWGKK